MSAINRNLPLSQTSTPLHSPVREVVVRWGWVLAAALPPLLFYLRTMAPTLYGLDSAELTTGAYTLGIVHPPGSPLYLLLAHVFTWLPLGDVGFRVNLLSVVAGTFTAIFLHQILFTLTQSRWIALITSWFCAFSYFVWISALAAELYAVQGAWVMGLLWLALRWRTDRQPWQLPLFTFLFGLGLGAHLSLVLLIPGFAVLLLTFNPETPKNSKLETRNSKLSPRLLLFAAATGILGSLIYLYLPIRYLAPDNLNYARDYWGVDLTTWQGFWWMVSGRIFGSLFLGIPPQQWLREFLVFLSQLFSNYWGLGLLLGLVGIWADLRRRPTLHLGLGLMFGLHLFFYLTYKVVDKQFMFVPAYLIWAIWLALGVQYLHQRLLTINTTPQTWQPIMPLLLTFLALTTIAANFSRVDVSQDWTARERGEAIFQELPANAVYYGTWLDVPILEYLQIVEEARPDVRARNLIFIGRDRAHVEVTDLLQAGITVYSSSQRWLEKGDFTFIENETCACYQVLLPPES